MYSRNAIRIYSLLISIVITFFIQRCSMKVYELSHNITDQIEKQEEFFRTEQAKDREEPKKQEELQAIEEQTMKRQKAEEIWQIMIPKIDVIAPIEEGVEQSTIKKAVGHFPRNRYMGRKCGIGFS